jgi:hypothetical protein
VFLLAVNPDDDILHNFLWKCIRQPAVFYSAQLITPQGLLHMYRSIPMHLSYKPAQFLRRKFDASCKVRFGFSLSARPTLKVPMDASIDRAKAAKFLVWVIQQMPIHHDLVQWFSSRAQIVYTASVSLGQVVLNHRQVIAKFDAEHPPDCVCSGFSLPRDTNGCVATRASEVMAMLHTGPLLAMSLSTKLTAGPDQAVKKLKEGIHLFHTNCILSILKRDPVGKLAFVPWIREQYETAIGQIWRPTQPRPSLFCVDEALRIKESLGDLVVLPLDRNINAAYIMCPLVLWHRVKTVFWSNPDYTHLQCTSDECLQSLRQSYIDHNFHKVVPMPATCAMGSAYILPKNKDTTQVQANCEY